MFMYYYRSIFCICLLWEMIFPTQICLWSFGLSISGWGLGFLDFRLGPSFSHRLEFWVVTLRIGFWILGCLYNSRPKYGPWVFRFHQHLQIWSCCITELWELSQSFSYRCNVNLSKRWFKNYSQYLHWEEEKFQF